LKWILTALVAGVVLYRGCPAGPGRDLPEHLRLKIETGDGIVSGVAFGLDGTRLVSGDYLTGLVATWDAASGRPLTSFGLCPRGHQVRSLVVAPDGRGLAVALLDQDILLGDLVSGRLPLRLAGTAARVAPAYTPDGRGLIAAGIDRRIRVFDTSTGRERRSWAAPGAGIRCLVVAPDGRTLDTGGGDGRLRRWDLDGGGLLEDVPAGGSVDAVTFSPDGRTLVSRGDGQLRLWDADTFRARPHSSARGPSPVVCQTFTPDGRFLATGHVDRVVRLWDPGTGRPLLSLPGHGHVVHSLAFSPDGRTLACGVGEGTILLWDMAGLPPASRGAGLRR
jgi:WD40 repeat protein